MAIGWLTILKNVPWGEVISHAPLVADGARKLWGAVAEKVAPAPPPAPAGTDTAMQAPEDASPVEVLQARVASLEQAANELHAQMLASSALIKELAEQNTQLIARIDTLQQRTRWLGWAAGAACAGLVVLAGLLLGR